MRKIESLHGIIRPDRDEAPPDAIFAITSADRCFNIKNELSNDVPVISLDVQMFVRMDVLSDGLKQQIKDEIRALPEFDRSNLHPDTIEEDCCMSKLIRIKS